MKKTRVALSLLFAIGGGLCSATVASASTGTQSASFSPSTTQGLKDPTWIADPMNYRVTKTPKPNYKVSVPILEYHEAKYTPGNVITLKPRQFLSEVEWLHRHGFHTINFGQLYAAMYYGYQLPSRPVLLTFDDGYESVYTDVYPILKKYGYQATTFVISGYVQDRPNRTVKYPSLTTSEIKELQASGVIDIESHTVHHTDLSKVSSHTADYELHQSALNLEKLVGHPIKFFCYPFGGHTDHVVSLVKRNGYLLATIQGGGYASLSNGPLALRRFPIYSNDTLATFAGKLAPSLGQQAMLLPAPRETPKPSRIGLSDNTSITDKNRLPDLGRWVQEVCFFVLRIQCSRQSCWDCHSLISTEVDPLVLQSVVCVALRAAELP